MSRKKGRNRNSQSKQDRAYPSAGPVNTGTIMDPAEDNELEERDENMDENFSEEAVSEGSVSEEPSSWEPAAQEDVAGEATEQVEDIPTQEPSAEETTTWEDASGSEGNAQEQDAEEPDAEGEPTQKQDAEQESDAEEQTPEEQEDIPIYGTPDEEAAPAGEEGSAEGTEEEEEEEREEDMDGADKAQKAEEGPTIHIAPWIYGVAFAIIFALCFLAYYLHAKHEPVATTETFLASIQTLDFDTMKSLLVNDDLAALTDADLGNPVYEDFFKDVNAKMSYRIGKTSFSLGNSESKVTARIHHIDGTELYEKVLNEFVLDIVSSAFSGETISKDDTQSKLVTLLNRFSGEVPDSYTDTEITYQLTKTEEGWKVNALDDQTVKVMSANFKSIEEEIESLLTRPDPDSASGEGQEGGDRTVFSLTKTNVINLGTDQFEVQFTDYKVAKDFAGNDCLLFFYNYTNNAEDISSAMIDVDLKAFQDGVELAQAIPNDNDAALENYYREVGSGETIPICQAFSLLSDTNVSVQATDSNGDISTQLIRLP